MRGRVRVLTGAKHDAAVALHDAGWNDPRIAAVFDMSAKAVAAWRKLHGIEHVGNFGAKIDTERALVMWREGHTDREIANEFGAVPSGVLRWRNRHGLERNAEPSVGLDKQQRRVALKMLREGASRRQVADAIGRNCLNPIQRLRREMGDAPGLRGTGQTIKAARLRALRDATALRKRILRAIGTALAPDIVADTASDMMLALLEDKLKPENIEREARAYGNRNLDRYASRFGPSSLDEQLGDDGDGFTLLDVLRDDRLSSHLEDMGASQW